MEEEDIDKTVLAYLRKKGYKLTELALQEEHTRLSSDASLCRSENDTAKYYEGYGKLRSWAYNSLDSYRHELLRVIYPVYIHCFMDLVAQGYMQAARTFFHTFREDHEMMHLRDLQKLEAILSPSHLEEMELARLLRQNKVKIKLCQYSYELLVQYLHKTRSLAVLGVINEHINFEVTAGQPTAISDDTEAISLVGASQDFAREINQKDLHWGLLEDSVEERMEKALSDSDKTEIDTNKEGDLEDNNKKRADGSKHGAGATNKKKKDKLVGATGKTIRSETTMVSVAPRVKSELTLPELPPEVEQSILEDIRNRVQLGSLALPSVSFYTFYNTHNGLNCSSISHDGSLVAGGFSDSSVKVWDMARINQPGRGC